MDRVPKGSAEGCRTACPSASPLMGEGGEQTGESIIKLVPLLSAAELQEKKTTWCISILARAQVLLPSLAILFPICKASVPRQGCECFLKGYD